MEAPKPKMIYRHLGPTGIKVSVLSYGNWVSADEGKQERTNELVKRCWEHGINFFDTAEGYGKYTGEGEELLGVALKTLNVPREELVISTKIYWGGNGVNSKGLSRKHIIEGTHNSLKRLQLDYVDIIYCHRPDPSTPMEETVRAMNWLIEHNKAFYWGTSEWSAEDIRKAFAVCERLGLQKPVVEQPEYNMLKRERFEKEYAPLFEEYRLGTTIWSPLAGGILTGKYRDGIPEDSRLSTSSEMVKGFYSKYTTPEGKEKYKKLLDSLEEVGKSLNASMAQLALAWALYNKDVSTAIFGATKTSQIDDNVKALEVLEKFTPEIDKKLNEILDNRPDPGMDYKTWTPKAGRRC